VVGLLGAFVIARWSLLLMQQSGRVLLDMEDDPTLADDIRRTLEEDLSARISDMHLWRLGPGHRGLIVSVVSRVPRSADEIKHEIRRRHAGLSHVTVEVSVCSDCTPAGEPAISQRVL
jgi:Co/Zn/Cd efflux system component